MVWIWLTCLKGFHLQVEAVSVVGESGPSWEVVSRCLDTNIETKGTLLLPTSNFVVMMLKLIFKGLEIEQLAARSFLLFTILFL
jgi:hypothetical protein